VSAPAPPPLPALLKRYMELARGVVLKVRHAVPMSSNYDATSSPVRVPTGKPTGMGAAGAPIETKGDLKGEEKKTFVDTRTRKFLYKTNEAAYVQLKKQLQAKIGKPRSNQQWLDSVKMVKQHCKASGIGNCGELAAMAVGAFYKIGARNIDYIQISTEDIERGRHAGDAVLPHVVCVVGRTGGSLVDGESVGLPSGWGADAVICDPWDRAVYPAADFQNFWEGIRKSSNGSTITCQLLHRFT
jgi:hypothetical protein